MDGDSKAKEYFQTHYNSDIKNIKIDFIDFEEFKQLVKQDNKFILMASSIQCEFCQEIVPNFIKLMEENKLDHLYFIKFDELKPEERDLVAKKFDQAVLPTILFYKNGNISQFQGEFKLEELSEKIEEFIKE